MNLFGIEMGTEVLGNRDALKYLFQAKKWNTGSGWIINHSSIFTETLAQKKRPSPDPFHPASSIKHLKLRPARHSIAWGRGPSTYRQLSHNLNNVPSTLPKKIYKNNPHSPVKGSLELLKT